MTKQTNPWELPEIKKEEEEGDMRVDTNVLFEDLMSTCIEALSEKGHLVTSPQYEFVSVAMSTNLELHPEFRELSSIEDCNRDLLAVCDKQGNIFVKQELDKVETHSSHVNFSDSICNAGQRNSVNRKPVTILGTCPDEKIEYLNSHRQRDIHPRSHACEICKKSYPFKSQLSRHQRTHTGEKPFLCKVCKKTFSFQSNWIRHQRTHTEPIIHDADPHKNVFFQKLNLDPKNNKGDKYFRCDVCEKSFRFRSAFDAHQRIHSGEKPFQCEICTRSFRNKSDLIKHYRIHTGQKPYLCKICGKTFSRAPYLVAHQRAHTGEKPYNCDMCNKRFAVKSNLTVHMKIHFIEKTRRINEPTTSVDNLS